MSVSDSEFDSLPLSQIRSIWIIIAALFVSSIPFIGGILSIFLFASGYPGILIGTLFVFSAGSIWWVVTVDTDIINAEVDCVTIPVKWSLLAAGVPILGPTLYIYKRRSALTKARKTRFHTICDEFGDRLTDLLVHMNPYLETRSYLTGIRL